MESVDTFNFIMPMICNVMDVFMHKYAFNSLWNVVFLSLDENGLKIQMIG